MPTIADYLEKNAGYQQVGSIAVPLSNQFDPNVKPDTALDAHMQRMGEVSADLRRTAARLEDILAKLTGSPMAQKGSSGGPQAVSLGHLAKMNEGQDVQFSILNRIGDMLSQLEALI